MAEQKLVEGKGNRLFHPDGTLTRAAASTVVNRALDYIADQQAMDFAE